MNDAEAHRFRLGFPLATIAEIVEGTLERDDLDEDLMMRLHAIRDLALNALGSAEHGDPASLPARPEA